MYVPIHARHPSRHTYACGRVAGVRFYIGLHLNRASMRNHVWTTQSIGTQRSADL